MGKHNICEECQSKFYLSAMSSGKCVICNANIVGPHLPCYKLCDKCSAVRKKCQQCGKDLK